jgi:hydrogenase maturation protease
MILIIGYGNSLRRDDGAGPVLAKRVFEKAGTAYLRMLEAHQLVPDLATELAAPDVSAVIFIDASVAADGTEASCILPEIEPREIHCEAATSSLSHHFDPETLLSYVELLYGKKPPAWLVSIPGVDFGYGEGFSTFALNSLAVAEDKVLELIGRLTS